MEEMTDLKFVRRKDCIISLPLTKVLSAVNSTLPTFYEIQTKFEKYHLYEIQASLFLKGRMEIGGQIFGIVSPLGCRILPPEKSPYLREERSEEKNPPIMCPTWGRTKTFNSEI